MDRICPVTERLTRNEEKEREISTETETSKMSKAKYEQ